MLEILKTLKERHYTNTKVMILVLVRCVRCGKKSKILKQNADKHNRKNRKYCQHCVDESYHHLTNTRIWGIWQGMRWRARNPLDKNYGGRGITVCEEWNNFEKFYEDMHNGYSDDLTIERVDVNKPYCKDNCIWATNMVQQANKRNNRVVTYQGEQIHLAELCRRSGFSKMMIVMRLNRGMTGDEAVEDAKRSPYGKGKRAQKNRMFMTS